MMKKPKLERYKLKVPPERLSAAAKKALETTNGIKRRWAHKVELSDGSTRAERYSVDLASIPVGGERDYLTCDIPPYVVQRAVARSDGYTCRVFTGPVVRACYVRVWRRFKGTPK